MSRVGTSSPLAFPLSLSVRGGAWIDKVASLASCIFISRVSKNYLDKRHTYLCLAVASTRVLSLSFFSYIFWKSSLFVFFFFCLLLGNGSIPPALLNCWSTTLKSRSSVGGLMRCDFFLSLNSKRQKSQDAYTIYYAS